MPAEKTQFTGTRGAQPDECMSPRGPTHYTANKPDSSEWALTEKGWHQKMRKVRIVEKEAGTEWKGLPRNKISEKLPQLFIKIRKRGQTEGGDTGEQEKWGSMAQEGGGNGEENTIKKNLEKQPHWHHEKHKSHTSVPLMPRIVSGRKKRENLRALWWWTIQCLLFMTIEGPEWCFELQNSSTLTRWKREKD